ncbi:type IV pilus assembly protein FimV [Undibacterium sp. TJN19]|uniref:type IV pilus assembly protein FimV n=1 Tax=Undibacterium sp. TJN19 TaxID=3413055 RepID=UPI003BF3BAF6
MQSGLGQQLKAQLDVTGNDAVEIEQSCFKAKVESPDGTLLATANVTLISKANSRYLILGTSKNLLEPAVKIMVDMGCEIQLHREFLVLLDPPQFAPAQLASSATALPKTSSGNTEAAPAGLVNIQPVVRPRPKKDKALPELSELVAAENNVPPTKKKSAKSLENKTKTDKNIAPAKDALKLSDDVTFVPQGLRLSDSLSAGGAPSNIEELRAAQAQLAAMLRDENPGLVSSDKLKTEQQKILSLQQEAQQLKRQSQLDKAALEETKESSFSRNWIIGLSVFVLAGLTAIALLLLYIARMRKNFAATWWQQNEHAVEPEPKKNIEEIVDSIQASYGPTTTGALYQIIDNEKSGVASRPVAAPSRKAAAEASLGQLESPSVFGKAYVPTLEDSNSSTFNFFSTRGQSVKVEEISDVTQEAEFWISVNDPQRAIEILEPLAEVDHPESPVPWLYLLDLYRVTENKEKYDGLRDRFVVFFNANIPEYELDLTAQPVRQLEDFEHLMNKICKLWTSNDILPFLESLLVDDRDGKRMGFELPVYRDILLLISVANELERSGGQKGKGWAPVTKVSAPDESRIAAVTEPDSNLINFETIDFLKDKE